MHGLRVFDNAAVFHDTPRRGFVSIMLVMVLTYA